MFAGTAVGATVAAYSVGQQIAIGALTFGIGFVALVFIFRVRSFKEVIARGREDRDAERRSRGAAAPRARPCSGPGRSGVGGYSVPKPSRASRTSVTASGKSRRHRRADLVGLLLGVALEVEPADAGDRHARRRA